MILLFLGNVRATVAVLLSIPISCIATFLILNAPRSKLPSYLHSAEAAAQYLDLPLPDKQYRVEQLKQLLKRRLPSRAAYLDP